MIRGYSRVWQKYITVLENNWFEARIGRHSKRGKIEVQIRKVFYWTLKKRKHIIVPGSRWNVLPHGTITRLALPSRQRLKPSLE